MILAMDNLHNTHTSIVKGNHTHMIEIRPTLYIWFKEHNLRVRITLLNRLFHSYTHAVKTTIGYLSQVTVGWIYYCPTTALITAHTGLVCKLLRHKGAQVAIKLRHWNTLEMHSSLCQLYFFSVGQIIALVSIRPVWHSGPKLPCLASK